MQEAQLIALILIGILNFFVIRHVFKEFSDFGCPTLLAGCVTVIGCIGLNSVFDKEGLMVLIVPYTGLIIAVLAGILLVFALSVWKNLTAMSNKLAKSVDRRREQIKAETPGS